ncbi:hypothetical protein PMIN03_001772 [Paraphaeosphaeria minitans]
MQSRTESQTTNRVSLTPLPTYLSVQSSSSACISRPRSRTQVRMPPNTRMLCLWVFLGTLTRVEHKFSDTKNDRFVISTFTFSMVLMGWGGASGLQAVVGIFFFTGPVLLLLSTIFLWIQAQFFPMMVCGLFCVFWLSFGVLQLPTLGLAASYGGGDAAVGAVSKEMNAVIALYLLVWGFALGTFWLFTIRINVVFAGIFGFVTIGAWVLSGAYWALSNGHFQKALRLQKTGAALLFLVGLLGWYMLFVIMAAEMRWRVCPPVGDLSHYWGSTDVEMGALEDEKRE